MSVTADLSICYFLYSSEYAHAGATFTTLLLHFPAGEPICEMKESFMPTNHLEFPVFFEKRLRSSHHSMYYKVYCHYYFLKLWSWASICVMGKSEEENSGMRQGGNNKPQGATVSKTYSMYFVQKPLPLCSYWL